jgi:Dolichyl-phosphate-mannose-protein mannosyltransferase
MAAGVDNDPVSSPKINWNTIAGVVLVSAVYFADLFLKASRKCFWFDELFTVYLCRLHNFTTTWTAVTHGADFNPPLLYLFTRWAQGLFGHGLIATRLPAMVGVWLFGVCLFLFVARRAGVVSGFVAGIFPFFTLAQYYAYEARAHGIVLGWCGLALVCWQRNAEGRAKNLWLAGFGLCLVGALLTHVYAVYLLFPFALVELYSLCRRDRPDWGIVAALALALISVTVTVYLPLFRVYRASVPATFFPGSHDLIQRFLVAVIGPAIGVLLLALILFALEGMRRADRTVGFAAIPTGEMMVAAGFVCIPLVGLLGSKVSHGPFIERYFLSSIAGYAIFLGFASSRLVGSWKAQALAACMLLLMVGDLGTTIYLTLKHRIVLVEPSTGLPLSTTPSNPMALYGTLLLDNNGLDILILPSLDYIYFFRYAPQTVVSYLYFGAPANDINLRGYERLAKGAHIDLKTTTFDPFLATHNRFLVYESGSGSGADLDAMQAIASAGYKLKSAQGDVVGIMYEYAR